jgi:hypothetical protein
VFWVQDLMKEGQIEFERDAFESFTYYAKIADIIPDNWMGLSGMLHAPKNLVSSLKVHPRVVWKISGMTGGHGGDKIEVGYCGHSMSSGNGLCDYHAGLKMITPSSKYSLVLVDKLPCGVDFYNAGVDNGSDHLDVLDVLRKFLSQGYTMDNVCAFSGAFRNVRGRSYPSGNFPSRFDSPESFYLDSNSSSVCARVRWDSAMNGKKENIEGIVQGLIDLGFREKAV